jgi:hypothetical protein
MEGFGDIGNLAESARAAAPDLDVYAQRIVACHAATDKRIELVARIAMRRDGPPCPLRAR